MPYKDIEKRRAAARRSKERNREKIRLRLKDYYQAHKEERRAYNLMNREKQIRYWAKYRKEHRESHRLYVVAWKEKNRERLRLHEREYAKRRRAMDPDYRILGNLRSRLRHALRGENKSARTIELLGCSPEFLRGYIESRFKPGMTWKNIEIDHIRPCFAFDLSDHRQQRECFHYTNLQPLLVEHNRSKGAKTA